LQRASLVLEEAPLFFSLAPREVAFLRERVHLRSFEPGAQLLVADEHSPGLYVIKSGLVSVAVQCDEASEQEIARLGSGECVGEMSLMSNVPCSATVRAVTESEAWFIERADFADLVEHCPGLWRNLCRILSHRLAHTSQRLGTEPSTRIVALALAYPQEEASALAVAIAVSLARQSGKRILLVDTRPGHPASAFVLGKQLPGLGDLLRDRSLLGEHKLAVGQNDCPSGIRIAPVCCEDGSGPSADETLIALEWLRPFYDCIFLLLPAPPSESPFFSLDGTHFVLAVVPQGQTSIVLPWLSCRCSPAPEGNRIDVAIVGGDELAPSAKRSIEEGVAARIRWLPEHGGVLHRMLRERKATTHACPESPFSRALDSLARRIAGIEVGLALGAGAAKGFAHIGVLKVLKDNNVPIDYVAGCSIGAIVGALHAAGRPLAEIERRLQNADRKLMRWTLPLRAVWSDAGLRQLLKDAGPTMKFQDLPTPFAAVATDLASGREVVLRSGLVWLAVQASASIPGIFPPTLIRGRYLIDGGLVNPVPTQTVRDMGADIVIAVDLMSPVSQAAPTGATSASMGSSSAATKRAPNLVETLWRSTEIMQSEITTRSAATADVTIQPKVGRTRWSDFSRRGRAFIAAGEEAATDALPELSRLLPFLNDTQISEVDADG